jgi:hypothetical protein
MARLLEGRMCPQTALCGPGWEVRGPFAPSNKWGVSVQGRPLQSIVAFRIICEAQYSPYYECVSLLRGEGSKRLLIDIFDVDLLDLAAKFKRCAIEVIHCHW